MKANTDTNKSNSQTKATPTSLGSQAHSNQATLDNETAKMQVQTPSKSQIKFAYIPKQTTENKDVIRTIVVTNPDGSQHTTTQTATFTRTNTQTDPQGSIIIGQWHTDNNQ